MLLFDDSPVTSVVIAGAGGFGRELFDYLSDAKQAGGPPVDGFIDDTPGITAPKGTHCPILSGISEFRPQQGQAVVVAIAAVKGRETVLRTLWANGVRTPAFIAPGAIVSPGAEIAKGVIICPLSIVNRDSRLDEGVVVNVHCSVAHGSSVGAFSVLSPFVAVNGHAAVGERCFLGTRATVYPHVRIGNDCIVDTHAGVRLSAGDRKMISSRGKYQVSDLRGL